MNKRVIRISGVVVGILLIGLAYGLLLRGISAERAQQTTTEEQIAALEAALFNPQTEGAESLPVLRAQLAFIQVEQATVAAELAGDRRAFPTEVDSTDVLAHIITSAAIHQAHVRQIQARDPVSITIDADTFFLLTYDVRVEGELGQLSAFFASLEGGPISTLSLDEVYLTALPTPTPPPRVTPAASPTLYRASMLVQVYVRPAGSGTDLSLLANTPIPVDVQTEQLRILLQQAREMEDWQRAISLLLGLRQIYPSDLSLAMQLVDAYVQEGQRRAEAGEYGQAQVNFQEALQLQPDNEAALAGLAALLPTPTPTIVLTPTPTIIVAETAVPTTAAETAVPPTPTAAPGLQTYHVARLNFSPNSRYPDLSCDWFGFAGQITDAAGTPLNDVTIRISASGQESGAATTLSTGEYEIVLGNAPIQAIWMVQLYENGTEVSDVVMVETSAECEAALIQMDWQRR